jgi:hypothetical protein
MRIYLFFIFLFLSSGIAAQKNNKYRYEYRFEIAPPNIGGKIEIKQEPAEMEVPAIRGTVKDHESVPIPFASLLFISQDSIDLRKGRDSIAGIYPSPYQRYIQTDGNGQFIFIAPAGRYQLRVSTGNHITLVQQIELHIHELLHVDIALAPIFNTTFYHIHSIKRLSKKEIEAIKKCVKSSWKNKNGKADCEKKGEYYLTFEI